MKAPHICHLAADLVGGERDRTHGTKRRNFENIARLWSAYLANRPYPLPLRPDEVGDLLELMKVARRQHGAHNLDDYIDAAGYAACAGEIASEGGEEAPLRHAPPRPDVVGNLCELMIASEGNEE
jgi:hypothetical protein